MRAFKSNIKPYQTLVKNFTSLSILQITNYLFPLITLPYLVRVLGPEKYGLVNFAMAFSTYFLTICEYGFNLSVTKQISINRTNKEMVNEIFSSVIISKIILGLFSLIILMVIIFSADRFTRDAEVYFLSFGIVLGTILFPIWFFQGTENMKYITLITFGVRLVGTVAIFLFIKSVSDYPILVLIYSLVSIIIGVTGLLVSIIKFRLSIIIPAFSSIVFQFKEGLQIFISTAAINLYTTTNIFLLGILVNDTAVGYFAAADKIRAAAQNIIPTISQTVFPHINKLLNESFEKFISFVKSLIKYQTIISFVISLLLFLFARDLIFVILGNQYPRSVQVLKIISFLPLLSSFTTIFTVDVLIPLNLKNDFMKTFLAAGVISLVTAFILVPALAESGTALASLIAEITAASFSFWFVNRKIHLVSSKWI